MLDAEEVHDAIARRHRSGPVPSSTATKRWVWRCKLSGPGGSADVKYFMQTFGQSNRSNPPHAPTGSPLQPMLLMQSPVVNDRVLATKDSRVQRLLDTYKDDNDKVVSELFLATLSRPPTDAERKMAVEAMAKESNVRALRTCSGRSSTRSSFSLTTKRES